MKSEKIVHSGLLGLLLVVLSSTLASAATERVTNVARWCAIPTATST
jgi:hypothetical protein